MVRRSGSWTGPGSLLATGQFAGSRWEDITLSAEACAIPELFVAHDCAVRTANHERAADVAALMKEFQDWADCFAPLVAVKIALELRGIPMGSLAVPVAAERKDLLEEFKVGSATGCRGPEKPLPMFKLAVVLALIALPAFTQSNSGGAHLARFRSTIDATAQDYVLYVPHSYDPARRYPLLIGLHEEESNHVAELKHLFAVPARYGESSLQTLLDLPDLPDVDYVVACPFARGALAYQGIAEQDVYDMIAEVKRRYAIDEDRVYLTGGSMGGGAALWMGLTRPDLWAAVAPVCAAVIPGSEELAGNALNLPIRLLHGDQDPAVPVASSRQWQKRFLDLGVPVDYVEFPGVRHNAWDFAYARRSLFEWFAARQRNRSPDQVRFSATSYRYSSAYWVRIDGLTPGTLASVDAVRSGTASRS